MDITISKADLSRAIQITQSAIAKRTTMPILVNFLLTVTADGLRISASDLEISAQATVKAEVRSTGSSTVNARIFADIVRELPEGDIKITLTEGERLEVTNKGSRFRVIGISADEYPALPGLGLKVTGKIKARQLSEMLSKTLYATSLDETRFNLNGVCFEMSGSKAGKGKDKKSDEHGERSLRMVATDGHRLAMVTRPAGDLSFNGKVIVPRRGLAELRKILDGEGDGDVGLSISEGFLVLEGRDSRIALRLIDGEYPDYGQVIPSEKGTIARVRCGDFTKALRRVMLMVSDREKCVRVSLSDNLLKISSSSPELGEASEELEVKYEGDNLTAGFNAIYLLEMAGSLGEDQTLTAEMHGELGPGKFYPESDEASVAIVMPMRL